VESNFWNSLIALLPNPHFLQSYEWGQVKAAYGWTPFYAVWGEAEWKVTNDLESLFTFHSSPIASALILKRTLSLGPMRLSVLYIPKGPNFDWSNAPLRERVLNDLQSFAKQQRAIFIKLDPDVVLGTGVPGADDAHDESVGNDWVASLAARGWVFSNEQIQFRNTVLIDVTLSADDILACMKQKTRYNVRLATKKGVGVRVGTQDDLLVLYRMYAETSIRDGFVIRDETYYLRVWNLFMEHGLAEPLIAESDGEPIAAIFVFYFGQRAYYVYGMSREAQREKMPNYLLQWEAMQRAKTRGCEVYDLWGAPDEFDETDSMWGVFRFKEGLGGYVVRTLGAWDFAPNKFLYRLYTDIMPRVLDLMRNRGRARTKRVHEGHE
jgi:lipid II:glycine glycyltransferase (peptidoglycan interpeptide bridge formation enzyme)